MSELLGGIMAAGGFMTDDREVRLWDGQWMNIVNHAHCWEGFTKEEAVHAAVKMAEEKMAENMMLGKWPTRRDAA